MYTSFIKDRRKKNKEQGIGLGQWSILNNSICSIDDDHIKKRDELYFYLLFSLPWYAICRKYDEDKKEKKRIENSAKHELPVEIETKDDYRGRR